MKIIDVLTGKERPIEFEYSGAIFKKTIKGSYVSEDGEDLLEYLNVDYSNINDEVKVIEEEKKPLTKQDVEALGYACGEIQKCFTNGWNKSLENKPFKEDKKIEKIELDGEYIINYDNDGNKHLLNTNKKDRDIYIKKINQLIDKVNNLENKR